MAGKRDSAITLTTMPLEIQRRSGERGYLLCFEGDSSRTFELPEAGEITIGRAPEVDLQLEDTLVSRRHAQLLITDSQVRLTDLGSRHGTLVNGERVRAFRHLLAGDVIALGAATLVFHREVRPSAVRPFLESGQLRQRLEEEIDRALHYQRHVSLVLLEIAVKPSSASSSGEPLTVPDVRRKRPPTRSTSELAVPKVPKRLSRYIGLGSADRNRLAESLAGHVRLIDAAGFLDAGRLAVLMPERDGRQASQAAERMVAAVAGVGLMVRAGVATCPDDGCDADTLLSGARGAAESGAAGESKGAAQAATIMKIGESSIVIADPAMHRVYELIAKLAKSDLPILITGATGTGKEIAATAIHEMSRRKEANLVPINCAALPEHLVESELFGHEKGAFTGAGQAKMGLLERASGGSVFLDELGELPLPVQAKLLRAIESQKILRVGDVKERAIDVRLIAATNRDLQREIAEGRFREDLFFRLSAARVVLPPLKDRTREVAHLARALLHAACERMGRAPLGISPGVMQRLFAYSWPGNVRELKNAMDYAAATAPMESIDEPSGATSGAGAVEAAEIELWHLPPELVAAEIEADEAEAEAEQAADSASPGEAETSVAPVASAAPAAGEFRPIADEVRELERARMVQALEAAGGVQNKAAELISMPLRTFVTKLKRYGIPTGRTRGKDSG